MHVLIHRVSSRFFSKAGPFCRTHLYPYHYGEFCIGHQRDDNCVTQFLCGDQLRFGSRPTVRRWSPGLETTGEVKSRTRPPSASCRWCHGLTTIGPQFGTLPRLRQSFENAPRTPFLTSHCTETSCQTSGSPGVRPRLSCRPRVARNPGTELTREDCVMTRRFLKRCGQR